MNNAYSGAAAAFEDMTAADLRAGMRVNAEGALIGMNLIAPLMTKGGVIVNVASIAAFSCAPQNAAYAAAKLALISLTQSAAVRLGRRDPPIRVNAVAPGMTRTPALDNMFRATRGLSRDADVDEVAQAATRRTPLRRAAEPRELANAILSSPRTRRAASTGRASRWTAARRRCPSHRNGTKVQIMLTVPPAPH